MRSPAELIEGDGNGEQPGGVRRVFDLEDVAGGGLHRETKGGYIPGTFSTGWWFQPGLNIPLVPVSITNRYLRSTFSATGKRKGVPLVPVSGSNRY